MAEKLATNASDPSVDGRLLAWHEAGSAGILVRNGQQVRLSGTHPALGGGRLAVIDGAQIGVRSTSGGSFSSERARTGRGRGRRLELVARVAGARRGRRRDLRRARCREAVRGR